MAAPGSADPARPTPRCRRRAGRRRGRARPPGRARRAAAASRTRPVAAPATRRTARRAPAPARAPARRAAGAGPANTASRTTSSSRSRSARSPIVTVRVGASMSTTYRRSPDRDAEPAPLTDREAVDRRRACRPTAPVGRRRSRPAARAMRSSRNASLPPRVMKQTSMLSGFVGGAQPEPAPRAPAPRPS